jgi:hypothetical protein
MAMLPEHAIVMHPGPMNRGMEIAAEVADSDRSVIVEQVANGVSVRMAVLYLLLGGSESAIGGAEGTRSEPDSDTSAWKAPAIPMTAAPVASDNVPPGNGSFAQDRRPPDNGLRRRRSDLADDPVGTADTVASFDAVAGESR